MLKDGFFEEMERNKIALTFNDVSMKTGHAAFAPNEADTRTMFSRNIALGIPIASAAMDTVTEHKMAIALALQGGIGVIHRNLSPGDEAKEVERVKYCLHSGNRIPKPITVYPSQTVADVLERKRLKGWKFDSFPVVDEEGRLVGVVTRTDFRVCRDPSRRIGSIMTSRSIVTAREGISRDKAFEVMERNKKTFLPLVDTEGRLRGLYTLTDLEKLYKLAQESGTHAIDTHGQLRVAAAVGVHDDALCRVEALLPTHIDAIVVDTAHGDSHSVIETVCMLKRQWSGFDVIAGNVSEPEGAKRLADAGADCIKVGQGGGSICTTRPVTGIGRPQLTAVYECAKALRGSGVPICSDGGIRYTGDIAKAIAAGADSVMLGGMLAGTDEAPGEVILYDGRSYKAYRGMGSLAAMKESEGSRKRYRQGEGVEPIPEGIEGMVPYKGPISAVLHQCVGGFKNSMGYVGGETLTEFQEKADFFRVTSAGLQESHPHDVIVTNEAPNYQRRGAL